MSFGLFCRLIAVLVLLGTGAFPAQASTEQKLSLAQLSAQADVIIRGQVETITTRQASDRRPISTMIQISVERQFKGLKVSTVTIEQPGGSQGDVTLGVPGSPEFSPGENVILFIGRSRGAFKIVGGKQGKFTIKTAPESSKEVVEDFGHRTEDLDRFIARLQK
jgi:hypothetical protein